MEAAFSSETTYPQVAALRRLDASGGILRICSSQPQAQADSPDSVRMDPVKERLEQLDKEAAALAAEVKNAWKVYKSTKDPEDKQRYEDLKQLLPQLLPQLNSRRAELEAKLSGAGGSVDSSVPELLKGLKKSNKEMLEQFKTDSEGEDKSRRFLYSNFLAEKFKLQAPYEQYGFYLSCGAGVFLLLRNLFRASQLLEVQACTDPAKKLELQELGRFLDVDVKYAARHAARFRSRGIAAGVGVPILWLAWRFAMHDGSSGSQRSKGKTAR